MFRGYLVYLSVHCSLVVTCWERAGLFALLYVMFYCVLVTFPCGVLGQVWCFIVSIPDICFLSYFEHVIFLWGLCHLLSCMAVVSYTLCQLTFD